MFIFVFLSLFLTCAGMILAFVVLYLLWYATNASHTQLPVKPATEKGLSESELEKLPKITGKELIMGTECAVCLDEIESDQPTRLVPGCNHGFHLKCADTWLSKHPICPTCRAKLEPQLFTASENPC